MILNKHWDCNYAQRERVTNIPTRLVIFKTQWRRKKGKSMIFVHKKSVR